MVEYICIILKYKEQHLIYDIKINGTKLWNSKPFYSLSMMYYIIIKVCNIILELALTDFIEIYCFKKIRISESTIKGHKDMAEKTASERREGREGYFY